MNKIYLKYKLLQYIKDKLFPNSYLNFSQTGEELIIQHLLKDINKGFYIDIGCYDPIRLSNTFSLYMKGWRGIAIDINDKLIYKYNKIRENDISICAAISDIEDEYDYFEFEEDAVNTMDLDTLIKWKNIFHFKQSKKVRSKTLTLILEENIEESLKIDLLTIDVEGLELSVIRSIDLTKFRPTLIVVEMHDFNVNSANSNEIFNYLKLHNYEMVSFATINGYFLDRNKK